MQLLYGVPRGSITLAGVYGTLHFVDSGNLHNSDTEILNAGYSYALTRKDAESGSFTDSVPSIIRVIHKR